MAACHGPSTTRSSCARSPTRCATGSWASSAPKGRCAPPTCRRSWAIPANQASFHLRQLAKYGLVEEAVGEGRDRRDRVWQLVDESGLNLDLGELEKQPGGPAAAAVFRAQAGAWAHTLVDAAYAGAEPPGIHRSITDQTMRLTVAEARELVAEVNEVVRQWADRTRGRDPERQTYSFLSIIQPLPENRAGVAPGPRVEAMPARLRVAEPAEVAAALARRAPADDKLLTKHFLAAARRARAGPFRRGPGPAVRRGAGDPRRPPHPRHPARGRRDRRRHLARAGDRRADVGRRRRRRAGSSPRGSGPSSRRTSRWWVTRDRVAPDRRSCGRPSVTSPASRPCCGTAWPTRTRGSRCACPTTARRSGPCGASASCRRCAWCRPSSPATTVSSSCCPEA